MQQQKEFEEKMMFYYFIVTNHFKTIEKYLLFFTLNSAFFTIKKKWIRNIAVTLQEGRESRNVM